MSKPSTLPFDQETLAQGIRVRPAQFARMCEVSKQAVSQWIAQGKITLYPDGTLDPAKAAREVINNSDPLRLRAKVFKAASSDVGALRKEIAALTQKLESANKRNEYLDEMLREYEVAEEIYRAMLLSRLDDIRQLDITTFAELLDTLSDESLIAAAGDLGIIDDDTGEPSEIINGKWREFTVGRVAFSGQPAPIATEGGAGDDDLSDSELLAFFASPVPPGLMEDA